MLYSKTVSALIIITAILLSGCCAWKTDQMERQKIIKECMQLLPAGPVTTKYNDGDEVVRECDNTAYYQSQKYECN